MATFPVSVIVWKDRPNSFYTTTADGEHDGTSIEGDIINEVGFSFTAAGEYAIVYTDGTYYIWNSAGRVAGTYNASGTKVTELSVNSSARSSISADPPIHSVAT